MFPDLVNVGCLHLHTYGACMAVGFLVCWKLIEKLSQRKDLSNLLLLLMLGGVLGSRIAYVIEHWTSEFAADPSRIVRIDQGGLMFYGGLIVSIAVFFVWCLLKRERPIALADLLCAVIPLGHAFGRLGCFFYGCCYGCRSDSFLAVRFPPHSPCWYEQVRTGLIPSYAEHSLPVLPTQLFEAAMLMVLFAVLLAVYLRWHRHTTGIYLMGYAAIRFINEFARGDERAEVGCLSIGQTISLVMFGLGVIFIVYGKYLRHHR